MNLIKVREIRGPRNEFLQKYAKSEISRNNLKCLRCAALPQASLAIHVFTYGKGHQQWVLPNATILGCSFSFLPSRCLLRNAREKLVTITQVRG